MTHTIVVPEEIDNPLYEGSLEFSPAAIEIAAREKGGGIPPRELGSAKPSVTLGMPQWWNLAHLVRERGEALPAELSLLLRDANFYLVQLACSFRPARDSEIEWVRFAAYLRPKTGQDNPVAFDIFPREIYEEAKRDVKVSIAPSLKFAAFEGVTAEGKPGEIATTIEFRKLEPVIIGYGVLESAPNWDFEKHKLHPLRGSRFCYLVVKKPHGAEAVRLALDITADVSTKHGLLSAKVTEKDQAHLSQLVCTD